MPALTIRIPADAAAALRDLAQVECRTPRDQAAFLVLQGLRAVPSSTGLQSRRRRPPVAPTTAPAEADR